MRCRISIRWSYTARLPGQNKPESRLVSRHTTHHVFMAVALVCGDLLAHRDAVLAGRRHFRRQFLDLRVNHWSGWPSFFGGIDAQRFARSLLMADVRGDVAFGRGRFSRTVGEFVCLAVFSCCVAIRRISSKRRVRRIPCAAHCIEGGNRLVAPPGAERAA
jgi:hypothetical protein